MSWTSSFISARQLSFVDADGHDIERLLAGHALNQRAKRLLVIMRDQMLLLPVTLRNGRN